MDGERCEMVQGDAALPPAGERSHLGVRVERVRSESAEEAHHRQVELAVTAEARRVDQPGRSVDIDKPVARPQVTMQARWGIGGPDQLDEAGGDRLEPTNRAASSPR
jgi:hypothetical protein